MALEVGQIIDSKYRIERVLGEGGMGTVYEGANVRIQRRVAIKVLHSSLADSDDAVLRFEREAQAAGRIGSDHILEILDLGELATGERFMVMEFLDGEPLANRMERAGRLAPEEIGPLMVQALRGLAAAHDAGITHRDLKPDNLFVLREKAGVADFVKLIDFGISKFQPMAGEAFAKTRTGTVMGTPYYMAPEQAAGAETDHRLDLYAVAAILYEAVTGRVPHDGANFNQLMMRIALDPPKPPRELVPELDADFEAIVLKGMAKAPADRFQTALEFHDALVTWLARAGVPVAPGPRAGSTADRTGPLAAFTPAPGSVAPKALPVAAQTRSSWARASGDGPRDPRRATARALLLGALAAAAIGGALWVALGWRGWEDDRAPAPRGAAASASATAADETVASTTPAVGSAASAASPRGDGVAPPSDTSGSRTAPETPAASAPSELPAAAGSGVLAAPPTPSTPARSPAAPPPAPKQPPSGARPKQAPEAGEGFDFGY